MKFRSALLFVCIGVSGCGGTKTHVTCTTNAQCATGSQAGTCVPGEDVCALPDPSCSSGQRYDPSSGKTGCVSGTLADMSVDDSGVPTPGDMTRDLDTAESEPDLAFTATDLAEVDMAGAIALNWTPKAGGSPATDYAAVFGTSSTDVWVVGAANESNVIHFTTTPAASSTSDNYIGLWGSSTFNMRSTCATVSCIRNLVDNTFDAVAATYSFHGLGGFGSTAWVAGNGGFILKNAGSGWMAATATGATSVDFEAIWASSTTDVYVVGLQFSASSVDTPSIYHSVDGTNFTIQTAPTLPFNAFLTAVWGSRTTDVYAVGTKGSIIHTDGSGTWSVQTSGTTNDLFGIFGTSANDVFVVGTNGTILHSTGDGTWLEQNSGTTHDLVGVWAASPSDVWAVGKGGTIIHAAPQ